MIHMIVMMYSRAPRTVADGQQCCSPISSPPGITCAVSVWHVSCQPDESATYVVPAQYIIVRGTFRYMVGSTHTSSPLPT